MPETKLNFPQFFRSLKRPSIGQIIFWGVAIALAIALFIFTRGLVASWRLTPIGDTVPVPTKTAPVSTAEAGVTSTPEVAAPSVELPPPWDGASRVTILIIGLDYRDWEAGQGAPRSDTMILLTIDPISMTAGILSIPRDMWVNIPGFGYGKINTAYMLGEAYKLPGGGPELARKTVENFLGISIQYYAQIDFNTFVRMIDIIGGIEVRVKRTVAIDPLGQDEDVYLYPGKKYHLDGQMALALVRARDTKGADVDRAERQQLVIMAIREKVLSPWMLPPLIKQAPALYKELSSGIRTNMALDDAVSLAVLAQEIPPESIKRGVIDYSMVTLDAVVVNGQTQDVFKPIPDKIRVLRDEIFTTGGPLSPMAAGEPAELMKAEAARVSVLNATGFDGMAGRTREYLISLGMNVVNIGNPDQYPNRTVVIDHSGKPYTLRFLITLMNLSSNQIQIRFDPNAGADIEIILGPDWAQNNPMP